MSIYYQDESVTLYHGDCLTEHREWLDADVLVTDPPYGVRHQQKIGGYGAATGARHQSYANNIVPNDSSVEVRDAALAMWGERPALVFGSWRMPRPEGTRHRLIWHKAGSTPGPARAAFLSNDEEIYVLGEFPRTSPPERTVLTTHEMRHGASGAAAKIGHPTPKPIDLMQRLIGRCPPGVIADPFAGSGATLLAAVMLGRCAIGVELEERYCEIAARRLSQGVLDFGEVTA